YSKYKSQPKVLDEILLRIDELQNMIRAFYHDNYWLPIKGDLIISQSIANKLFDLAVNMGINPAVKCLQKAIEICCCNINVDGVIGNATLDAINKCNDVHNLLSEFKSEAKAHYENLNKPEDIKGWLNRLY